MPMTSWPLTHQTEAIQWPNLKTFGVTIPGAPPDRPYAFVKLETDAGLVGWGEGTLEGKAGAVMACINDFREFLIGADPVPWSITGNRCTSTASTEPVR
jgi:L-alanine-DL-glutamate epimerase-like enolase superfamily enzyme